MRIAFVSVGDPSDVKLWSGIPNRVLAELRRQSEYVEVVGPLNRSAAYLYAPLKMLEKFHGREIQWERHRLAQLAYAKQVEARLKGKNFDAVVAMSSIPIANAKLDAPIFFWTDAVFECMRNYYPAQFSCLSKREVLAAHNQEYAALSNSSAALYSSDWAAAAVREHYPAFADKVKVVEFGANTVNAQSERRDAFFRGNFRQRPVKLLFVGVDWLRKGGPLALKATQLLNDRGIPTSLTVIGAPSPPSPLVHNLGFVDVGTHDGKETMKEAFAGASFFFLPTRAEAAGIVFSESSSFGLPIITTATGGVGNYVRDGINGYCLSPDASADEYADLIESVLANERLYRDLADGGLKLHDEKLNWSVGVQKLMELIQMNRSFQRAN